MDKAKTPSLLNLAGTAVVIIVLLIYGFVALSTEDPIWFVSTYNEYPEEIFINCYGSTSVLLPNDPLFDSLVSVINETFSSRKNYDPLTMSDETYQYYLTSKDVMVLEIIYTQKVRIHSFYKFFSNLDSIIVPLDGRHSKTNAIFGRSNAFSTAGSLHYDTLPQVRSFVESNGICSAP